MEDTNRINNESFDDYALRMIDSRVENGLEYNEVYELLTGEIYANDNSRKSLYGIKHFLLMKKQSSDEELGKEIERLSNRESVEIKADNSRVLEKFVLACEEDFKTPQRILEMVGYDPKSWEITNSKISKWNVSGGVGNSNKILYSVKCTVKPIVQEFDIEWIEDTIAKIDFSNIKISPSKDIPKDGYIVEINFADVHLGKYVTTLVSDDEYNLDIAVKAYLSMVDEALDRVKHLKVKKFLFTFGQDFINIDTKLGTTRGTRQDMDRFFDEIYKTGLETLITAIEKIRIVAPVEAIYVKGNHDAQSTYTMGIAIEKMYEFNKILDVTVDSTSHQRKYRRFGEVALCFTHGNLEKARLFEVMQIDRPDLMVCKTKEIHCSHFHEENTKTKAGIVIRRLNSPSASCLWTWESGYGGSQKVGNLFVYDELNGLKSQEYIWARKEVE